MNTRIKAVRKDHSLTMRAFAARIGITSAAVAHLESGENNPSEQTLRAICSEFNVNRTWLETGEGEPYVQADLPAELSRVLQSYPALRATLEHLLSRMDDQDWQALDRFLGKFQHSDADPE